MGRPGGGGPAGGWQGRRGGPDLTVGPIGKTLITFAMPVLGSNILQSLNGDVLDDVADFYRKLWASGPAGTAVTLRMERDNDAFEVTVRSGDRSKYHKYGSD